MNEQERLFRALDEIAQEAIPKDKDLWPGLQATLIQPKRGVSLRRVSTGWIIVIFALIFNFTNICCLRLLSHEAGSWPGKCTRFRIGHPT